MIDPGGGRGLVAHFLLRPVDLCVGLRLAGATWAGDRQGHLVGRRGACAGGRCRRQEYEKISRFLVHLPDETTSPRRSPDRERVAPAHPRCHARSQRAAGLHSHSARPLTTPNSSQLLHTSESTSGDGAR
eukprot:scaffold47816_cov70-Phaeocystis_antarctica.AAC.1